VDAGAEPALVEGMSGSAIVRALAAALAALAVATSVDRAAGAAPRAKGPRWEIVPTVGVAAGGDVRAVPVAGGERLDAGFVWGLAVARALRRDTAVEAFFLHHETGFDSTGAAPGGGTFGLSADSVQVGGVYRPATKRRARPFVSASLGVTRYEAEPGGFDSADRIAMALGGGWTVPVSGRTGLRFTLRGWLAFEDVALAGTCGAGDCSVVLASDGALRLEATLGLVLRPGRGQVSSITPNAK